MALGPGCTGLVGGVLEASGQWCCLDQPQTGQCPGVLVEHRWDKRDSQLPPLSGAWHSGIPQTCLAHGNQARSELVAGPQMAQSTGFGLGQTRVVIY